MALIWDPYSQTFYDNRSLSNANIVPYTPQPSNPSNANANTSAGGSGLLSRIFKGLSGIRGKFGEGRNIGPDLNLSGLRNLGSDIRATRLFGGPKIGTLGAAGMGAYQGINAAKGLIDNVQSDQDYDNILKDIRKSAYANPMAAQYLTSDQKSLLRQARTGNLDTANWGGAAAGAVQGIPQALLSTLIGGLVGGPAGAAIGGLGSLGNSAIQGYGNRTREQTDKLSGLYSALQNAEISYNDQANQRIRNRHFNYMY